MRRILKVVSAIIALGVIAIITHVIYLITLSPNEEYPLDTYLETEKNKTALIIVAHDDDAVVFAGTTSKLAENGWDVSFLCFYSYHWRPEDNPVRKKEMEKVASIQGLKNIELIDLELRNRLDTVGQPWMPIPYDQFGNNYNVDSLQFYVLDAINKYNPSVIFMLDNVIGLYGHPEHVLVGKIVEEVCQLYQDSSGFSVKKIYQGVIPPSCAEKTMGGTYVEGKKIYHCNGMPLPEVQIDISSYAKKRKLFSWHMHLNIET